LDKSQAEKEKHHPGHAAAKMGTARLLVHTSEAVQRAFHPQPRLLPDVGVNHRRRHVLMAGQFLHRADVIRAWK